MVTKRRQIALDIIDKALLQADPYRAVKSLVRLDNDTLTVGEHCFNLKEAGRIFVLGAGKATFP